MLLVKIGKKSLLTGSVERFWYLFIHLLFLSVVHCYKQKYLCMDTLVTLLVGGAQGLGA